MRPPRHPLFLRGFRLMIIALLAATLGFAAIALMLILKQEAFIYHPRSYTAAERTAWERQGIVPLPFRTEAGEQTAFWLPPTDNASREPFVWVLFPGNGGRALDYLDVARSGPDHCGWLFVDYPGYGLCEGEPSPVSIRANALGALAALKERGLPQPELSGSRFGCFGHSIGAAPALDLAATRHLPQVIALAPFTSMKAMAARYITPLLTGFLRHSFDNHPSLEALQRQGARVTILHGEQDKIVPPAMSKTLARAYSDSVRLILLPTAGHNDILWWGSETLAEVLEESSKSPTAPGFSDVP